MKQIFEQIMEEYNEAGEVICKDLNVFQNITKNLPEKLRQVIPNSSLIVKGSMGQGTKSDCPWVSILNPKITTTTQSGLYIVFLFKKDMSGFYLTLNQGIKNLSDLFKNKKYEYAIKLADFFKREIEETTFSKSNIHLGDVKSGERAYGYEKTTILHKYYEKNAFNDEQVVDDLLELIDIYNDLSKLFTSSSYNDLIKDIIADTNPSIILCDDALKIIKDYLYPNEDVAQNFGKQLHEIHTIDKIKKFKRLTNPEIEKIEYLSKVSKELHNSLLGEALVINYEKEKLITSGRPDLATQIKWISKKSNKYSYDIESFEIDTGDKVLPIKIKVNVTSFSADVDSSMFGSEILSNDKYTDRYYIYRIYGIDSVSPKVYKIAEFQKNSN